MLFLLVLLLLAPLGVGCGFGWLIVKRPKVGVILVIVSAIVFALIGMANRVFGIELLVAFGLAWIVVGTAFTLLAESASASLAGTAALAGSFAGVIAGWTGGSARNGGEWGGLFGGLLGELLGALAGVLASLALCRRLKHPTKAK